MLIPSPHTDWTTLHWLQSLVCFYYNSIWSILQPCQASPLHTRNNLKITTA